MPQGRRKVPFSAKQKKQQLQQKRQRKYPDKNAEIVDEYSSSKVNYEGQDIEVINKQPKSSRHDRYHLIFKKEKDADIKQRIVLSREPFEPLPEEKLEVSYEEVFVPGSELDMPKRPPWDFSLSKEKLEANEQKYFRLYLEKLEGQFGEKLSHFDMNIETWRQLWRVIEFSDVVLLVTDARCPVFHFSPALYDYVTKDLKKSMILVLNKIDLIPSAVVIAWKEYFLQHFPQLHIMCFASYAGMILKDGKKGKRIGKLHMAIEGARYLMKMCEEIVNGEVDLSSWSIKIEEEAAEFGLKAEAVSDKDDYDEEDDNIKAKIKSTAVSDTSYYGEKRYKDGILTIGFVGHPNVGKSSFLNAIMGRKVVSVSRTPGHTKHYQTILLTPTVRLCDCPGLVFPSLVPKPMQVLMGCYPISQLREPYSVIGFLCQRVPVHKILKLQHPEYDSKKPHEELKWSAYDICEAFAKKRGFRSAHSARLDTYRAANNILRMALDGRTICLCFYPPNFTKEKDIWYNHPEKETIEAIQRHRQKEFPESISSKPVAEPYLSSDDQNDSDSDSGSKSERTDEEREDDDPETLPSSNKFDILNEL